MIDTEKVLAEASAELDRLNERGAEVVLKMPMAKVVLIIGLIQVTLRHPDLPPDSRAAAQQFCDNLIELIGRASPIMAYFCKLGFTKC